MRPIDGVNPKFFGKQRWNGAGTHFALSESVQFGRLIVSVEFTGIAIS